LSAATADVGPEVIDSVFVWERYLSELGGQTQLGRFFTAEENRIAGRAAADRPIFKQKDRIKEKTSCVVKGKYHMNLGTQPPTYVLHHVKI
jgi:hypothetical protein